MFINPCYNLNQKLHQAVMIWYQTKEDSRVISADAIMRKKVAGL